MNRYAKSFNKFKKPDDGFWGPRTATIDWCEINYEVTYYIAEFWNTISNLVMILLPLYGIFWSIKHLKYANKLKSAERDKIYFRVPSSVIWCHIGLILVGTGSWMFHMTLLYPMQLLDELPMIFCSGILIYSNYDLLFTTIKILNQRRAEKHPELVERKKSTILKLLESRTIVLTSIVVYCVVFSIIYVFVWKNPIFHEFAYAIMVLIIVVENVALIIILNLSKRLYVISFVYYMFGFILWNIDNNFCDTLKYYRSNIDNFFGIDSNTYMEYNLKSILFNSFVMILKSVFEFHSLWHLFTGYASFLTILFLTEAHFEHNLKINLPHLISQKHPRPVGSKFLKLYYHLTNNLIQDENGNSYVVKNETEKKVSQRKII